MIRIYRNYWRIEYNPPPIPTRSCDWHYWHDDFDGAPDANDNRFGYAPSLEAAEREIDDRIQMEEDERHASDCAIFNAPALPVGPCNCGVAKIIEEEKRREASDNGQFGLGA